MNSVLRFIKTTTPVVAIAAPLVVFAQTIQGIIFAAQDVLNVVIPVLFVLATVVFLWGIIRYVTAGGNEDNLKQGKQLIIWGLVGLAIMVAVWGIVRAIVNTFGVGGSTIPTFPGA